MRRVIPSPWLTPAAVIVLMGFAEADEIGEIPVIDTHIHLYDTNRPGGVPWPTPSDRVLYRPVLAEHFLEVADANGVAATIVVEASDRFEDNRWVLNETASAPSRFIGLVAKLPPGLPRFHAGLADLSADPRFVGVRIGDRRGADDYFIDDVWRDLKSLAAAGKTLDVLMFHFTLKEVAEIGRRLPELRVVVNHLGNPIIDGGAPDPAWIDGIRQVARHRNIYCKVSGLAQQSHRQPSPTDVEFYRPTLDAVTRAFSVDRLVYGSNWPVTMRGGAYGDFKKIVVEYYAPHGRETLEKVLYKNALKAYSLERAWETLQ